VVLEELRTTYEDSTLGPGRADTVVWRDTSDKEVGAGKEQPQKNQGPLAHLHLLELLQFGTILVEDVVRLHHVLLELPLRSRTRRRRLLELVQPRTLHRNGRLGGPEGLGGLAGEGVGEGTE
jgi:hypothetical protein